LKQQQQQRLGMVSLNSDSTYSSDNETEYNSARRFSFPEKFDREEVGQTGMPQRNVLSPVTFQKPKKGRRTLSLDHMLVVSHRDRKSLEKVENSPPFLVKKPHKRPDSVNQLTFSKIFNDSAEQKESSEKHNNVSPESDSGSTLAPSPFRKYLNDDSFLEKHYDDNVEDSLLKAKKQIHALAFPSQLHPLERPRRSKRSLSIPHVSRKCGTFGDSLVSELNILRELVQEKDRTLHKQSQRIRQLEQHLRDSQLIMVEHNRSMSTLSQKHKSLSTSYTDSLNTLTLLTERIEKTTNHVQRVVKEKEKVRHEAKGWKEKWRLAEAEKKKMATELEVMTLKFELTVTRLVRRQTTSPNIEDMEEADVPGSFGKEEVKQMLSVNKTLQQDKKQLEQEKLNLSEENCRLTSDLESSQSDLAIVKDTLHREQMRIKRLLEQNEEDLAAYVQDLSKEHAQRQSVWEEEKRVMTHEKANLLLSLAEVSKKLYELHQDRSRSVSEAVAEATQEKAKRDKQKNIPKYLQCKGCVTVPDDLFQDKRVKSGKEPASEAHIKLQQRKILPAASVIHSRFNRLSSILDGDRQAGNSEDGDEEQCLLPRQHISDMLSLLKSFYSKVVEQDAQLCTFEMRLDELHTIVRDFQFAVVQWRDLVEVVDGIGMSVGVGENTQGLVGMVRCLFGELQGSLHDQQKDTELKSSAQSEQRLERYVEYGRKFLQISQLMVAYTVDVSQCIRSRTKSVPTPKIVFDRKRLSGLLQRLALEKSMPLAPGIDGTPVDTVKECEPQQWVEGLLHFWLQQPGQWTLDNQNKSRISHPPNAPLPNVPAGANTNNRMWESIMNDLQNELLNPSNSVAPQTLNKKTHLSERTPTQTPPPPPPPSRQPDTEQPRKSFMPSLFNFKRWNLKPSNNSFTSPAATKVTPKRLAPQLAPPVISLKDEDLFSLPSVSLTSSPLF
jgi:hypothetical protein